MNNIKKQAGLTLIEVAVAIAIMAVIFVLSQQTISVATDSFDVSEKNTKRIEQIDRVWFYLKDDLKYVLARDVKQAYGPNLPPFAVEYDGDPILVMLRSAYPNPLALPRTEVVRVAYRLQEGVISRHIWLNPTLNDIELAKGTKLLNDVEAFEVKVLPPDAKTERALWQENWFQPNAVPLAVEIMMTLKDRGEMKRTFFLQ